MSELAHAPLLDMSRFTVSTMSRYTCETTRQRSSDAPPCLRAWRRAGPGHSSLFAVMISKKWTHLIFLVHDALSSPPDGAGHLHRCVLRVLRAALRGVSRG